MYVKRNTVMHSRNHCCGGKTMISVCVVELHSTVNCIKIVSVTQQCFYGKFIVAGNNQTYLGLHVNCPMLR